MATVASRFADVTKNPLLRYALALLAIAIALQIASFGESSANVRIFRHDDRVLVEVEDQGKGIPQDKLIEMDSVGLPGVGIRGMRERIRQLGGHLEISSSSNGTTIRVRLPFAGAASRAVA